MKIDFNLHTQKYGWRLSLRLTFRLQACWIRPHGHLKKALHIHNMDRIFAEDVFVLFDLILYVPSRIFQLNRDGSSWVQPVLS